jgi:hypothetical protein
MQLEPRHMIVCACSEAHCLMCDLLIDIISFQVNSQLISNVCTDALSAEKVMDLIPLF